MNASARKSAAVIAVVSLYFLLLAHRGLKTFFTPDDLTNIAFLHGYGRVPLTVIVGQALAIFTPEYRPMGGLYYRVLFALFGLHPLPFRIIFFGLLIANLALAQVWFRRLSKSAMTAACATLLFAFQPAMAELYFNDGTVYDVLCVLFVLVLLIRYASIRQNDRSVAGTSLLLIMALYGAALGSKEMAMTVPVMLVLYEIVFHPNGKNLRARVFPICVLALMTAVYMALKVLVPNQMSSNPGYAPHLRLAFIWNSYLHFYQLLFFKYDLTGAVMTGVLLAALALAIALRNRLMLFGLLFANLALFPVSVIPPRAGFVWYMPLLGYALYGGTVVSLLAEKLVRAMPSKAGLQIRAAMFGALVVLCYAFYAGRARDLNAPFMAEQTELRTLLAAAKSTAPTLPKGARILIEKDPHSGVWWLPLFLLRLGYVDPSMWVERVAQMGDSYDPQDVGLYDLRMRWDGSHYEVVTQSQPAASPMPIDVVPRDVRRGHTAGVQLPGTLANCAIDVAYRMPDDELMRGGVWKHWSELDGAGHGTVRVNMDAERGLVVLDRVRVCGGSWVPAHGSFVAAP